MERIETYGSSGKKGPWVESRPTERSRNTGNIAKIQIHKSFHTIHTYIAFPFINVGLVHLLIYLIIYSYVRIYAYISCWINGRINKFFCTTGLTHSMRFATICLVALLLLSLRYLIKNSRKPNQSNPASVLVLFGKVSFPLLLSGTRKERLTI